MANENEAIGGSGLRVVVCDTTPPALGRRLGLVGRLDVLHIAAMGVASVTMKAAARL